MEQYLVLDMGGTFIKYALMDAEGGIIEQGKTPSPVERMDELLDVVGGLGARFAGRYVGAAVSMPGRIDTAAGIAHTGGSFKCMVEQPAAALFAERLGCPVCIANDGKCAANAEAWRGALAGVANGAVIVLGTGTGGGIVLDHQIWMGSTFGAGELSFLPVLFKGLSSIHLGDDDWSEMRRFWSNHASATGLLRTYAARKGVPYEGLDGLAFFAAYDAGEPEAHAALEDFGEMTAVGIYAIQTVLDLERYAIGGGISARPEVTEVIRRKLDDIYTVIPFNAFCKPEIVRCRYGNDANLLGALRFALNR